MGVSQILYMYITSLINIAFNIMSMETNDMLKLFNLKAYKYKHIKENEIVTKSKVSKSPKAWWFSHQNILDSDASNVMSIKFKRIHHHQISHVL